MSQNGRLDPSELAPIAQGRLALAAAAAWNAMNQESRSLGIELVPTGSKSSYRTYEQQVELWNLYQSGRGSLAAHPGSSNHGWGLAVDTPTIEMHQMIERIGAKYGYQKRWSDAPTEPWHVKYTEGHYDGPDPGPYGQRQPEPQQAAYLALGGPVAPNADGRLEVFNPAGGEVKHKWQQAPNQAFVTDWSSLGKPY